MVLVRFKNLWRYYCAQYISVFFMAAVFVSIHLIIAFTMAISLPFYNYFSFLGADDSALAVLSVHFETPLLSLVSSTIYLLLGMSVIGAFSLFLSHYLRRGIVIVIFIAVYFTSIIGVSNAYATYLAPCFLVNYLDLACELYNSGGNICGCLLGSVAFICFSLLVMKRAGKQRHVRRSHDNGQLIFLGSLVGNSKNLSIILLGQLLLTVSVGLTNRGQNYWDYCFRFYYGNGVGYIELMDILRTVLYNGIPIYLLCVFLQNDATERSAPQIIRLGSTLRWYKNVISSALIFIVCYVLLTPLFLLLPTLLMGVTEPVWELTVEYFEFAQINPLSPFSLIALAVTLRIMELFLQFILIFVIYAFSGLMSVAFLALQAFYILSLTDTLFQYSPMGMSSLAKALAYSNMFFSFLSIGVWILAMSFIAKIIHKKIVLRGV